MNDIATNLNAVVPTDGSRLRCCRICGTCKSNRAMQGCEYLVLLFLKYNPSCTSEVPMRLPENISTQSCNQCCRMSCLQETCSLAACASFKSILFHSDGTGFAPMILRPVATTPLPSHTMAITGPEHMYSTRGGKKGLQTAWASFAPATLSQRGCLRDCVLSGREVDGSRPVVHLCVAMLEAPVRQPFSTTRTIKIFT